MAADPISITDELGGGESYFDRYTDYRHISIQVADAVNSAVQSYALVDSLHVEGASFQPIQAAQARADILAAAMMLRIELEDERDDDAADETFGEIVDEWAGEEGYIRQLQQTSLYDECPDWLHEFVADIRRAAWHLGYLKAGRYETEGPEPDPDPETTFEEVDDE